MRGAVLSLLLLLTGCGYVGDVQPPALNIPPAVNDLKVMQRGGNLELTFTIAALTTENLPLRMGTVEVRVGPSTGDPFDINRWAETATRIEQEPAGSGPAKFVVSGAPYAGKAVVAAVRLYSRKGRASGWSNVVPLNVFAALQPPSNIVADSDPQGVKLTWTPPPGGANLRYRVYRLTEQETEPALLATVEQPLYVDTTAQYGKPYRYSVQTIRETAESEIAAVRPITPVDIFPPAVPTGLNVIVGINTIELNWDRSPSLDFAFFRVYRTVSGSPPELIADNVPTPVFSDRKLQAGQRYSYTVRAVDQRNNPSAPCAPVEAVAP